jgi:hypothetical protein
MKIRIPLRGGDEQDAFSGWRRLLRWRPGDRKRLKKQYAKRLRKWMRCEAEGEGGGGREA